MNGEFIIIMMAVALSMLVLLIAKLVAFFEAFAKNTAYICFQMDHAENHEEYRRWRGELRCHYLCLLPFVNGRNVMWLYDRIYHRPEPVKEERKDSLVPLLLPSFLGICLCFICISGMTWAWYTASVEVPQQKLTAAHYEIGVEVEEVEIENSENTKITPDANGSYMLPVGTYTVTLTAQGDASTGYCKIKISDEENELHTEQIYTAQGENQKNSITFTIKVEDGSKSVSFLSVWGTYSGKIAEISDGTEYVIPAPEPTVPQETTPAETEHVPTEPPTTDPSNTPVTDAPTLPEEPNDEPVSNDTSDPADPE